MSDHPSLSPYAAGLSCKCPQCGQGDLFSKYLTMAERCYACGLDYSKADSGDGPAVFAIFIVGFLAVAVVFLLRFSLYLPMLIAFLGGIIVILLSSFYLLPRLKALLFALQYANKAEVSRLDPSKGDEG